MRRVQARSLAVVVVVLCALGCATSSKASRPGHGGGAAAPGGPGAQSYLDLARKDCFATAANTTSKVWFTVADGVLSDTFSPSIQNSNVNTLQYVVTDGRTFTDMQQRDMTYTVSSPDRSGMVCRVTSRDPRHGFALQTDYLTDPARDSVVMHTTLEPLSGASRASLRRLKVYVRYDAQIDNTGGGGTSNALPNDATIDAATGALVASDTTTPTGPWAAQVVGALTADRRFTRESSGFVGTPSDGLDQLDTYHRLRFAHATATAGNVVQTAQLDDPARPFTLALGFGPSAAAAVATAQRSATTTYAATLHRYEDGWNRYDASLHRPPAAQARAYFLSANVMKAAEDKTDLGAFVAAPADPWGQSMLAATTHAGYTYRSVFARDSYETFTGLLADGDATSARQMVTFLYDRAQQPDGSFPRDSELDGSVAPDTYGLYEIDEDSYPLLMAWDAGFAGDQPLYGGHLRPDADFVVSHGPAYGEDRWEEHTAYSPSTIASEIAGLTAAAHLAQRAGDPARALLYQATADDYLRNVKAWTVTDTGPYGDHRYFIRLSPTGDPNAAETYDLNNGSLDNVDQRSVVDAGFLELTRLGELQASDPDVTASLKVVDSVLERQTPSGPGWHRYGVQASGSTDGYGDCYEPDPTDCSPSGAPSYNSVGSGHLWPILDGERAEQDLQTGDRAGAGLLQNTMGNMSWGVGLMPEQAWEDPNIPAAPYGANPATASIGFIDGKAAGSATPLIWAEGQYVRLIRDLQTGRVVDQPAITRDRYVTDGPPSRLGLTITSPASGASIGGSSTTVTGTTTPGAQVSVASAQPGSATDSTTVVGTSATNGHFSVTVPTPPGSDLITVAAGLGSHASGWAQETVTGS
ncbi:MAG TPA: glycoside hydrolase family 15 protein [Solirubrobacteraceae bacterium]|nr:glycoside hydrolase family 15 protein [Solirubrobacteraceae bacterium]